MTSFGSRATVVVGALLTWLEPAIGHADQDPVEVMAQEQARVMSPDAGRLGAFYHGTGRKTDWVVMFEAGKCYYLSAAGGPGVNHMLVYLWGPDGRRITENRSHTTVAAISHCATVSGPYKFQGKIEGNGPYVVGLYARGAPQQPIADVQVVAPPPAVVQAPPPVEAPPPPMAACDDGGEQGSGSATFACDGGAIDVYFDGQFLKHAPGEMPLRVDGVAAGCHQVKVDCWTGAFKHSVFYNGPVKIFGNNESRYFSRRGTLDLGGRTELAPPAPPVEEEQQQQPPPPEEEEQGPPPVSEDVEPPVDEPAPVGVEYAPPPMLVESPPPMPYDGASWVGGYWHWNGDWVWARGRWMGAPRPGYLWTVPYYENRAGLVVYVPGFWRSPQAVFVAPPPRMVIPRAVVRAGVRIGPRPVGPSGVFVPPPPGSRRGLIVPAPIGTHPAVMISSPPIVRTGMTIRPGAGGHVSVVAPAGVTRGGAAVTATVPLAPHRAAALPPPRAVLPPPTHVAPQPVYHPAPVAPQPVRVAPQPVYHPAPQPVRPAPQPVVQPVRPAVTPPPPAKRPPPPRH